MGKLEFKEFVKNNPSLYQYIKKKRNDLATLL